MRRRWIAGSSPAMTTEERCASGTRSLARRLPLHRLRQTGFRRTRLQRLLLAVIRRPARQPDHVEGGANAAVGIGKAFAVNLRHPQQRGAAGRRPPPPPPKICLAPSPRILPPQHCPSATPPHCIT